MSAPDATARWTAFFQSYDVILVNSSAGKDSQAMLDYVAGIAKLAGVEDRVVVVHADLGRVEWQGTKALAKRQADHYGYRFEVVKRPQGDLLDHAASRGRWPSPAQRYCTSDHKRGQVQKIITSLSREVRKAKGKGASVRILNCLGLRAQESPNRAKMPAFQRDERAGCSWRTVDKWLPIHDWSEDAVWDRIERSGVPHHPAYDLGMPRLSCVFCIFAPKRALLLAGKHNPALLAEYVKVEEEIGHTFKANLSLAEIQAELEAGADVPGDLGDGNWNM
jgi:3'-phosphoadenosine 5'-phosphosulfate sulfotransferase (PAPS reductase)/FAD synthetase